MAEKKLRTRHFDDKVLPWLLMAPAVAIMAAIIGYPLISTFWLSLHEGARLQWGDFIGLAHYARALGDPIFIAALARTLAFTVAVVLGTFFAGLVVASVLNALPPVQSKIVAVLVLLPWAMPRVSSGIIWKWMFDDRYGVVNWALSGIGLEVFRGFSWFSTGVTAFVPIGLANIWQQVPMVALALYAGLRTISPDVVEASRLDGAGPIRQLWSIKLPMILPLVMVLLVLTTISAFQAFDHVFVMTIPPGGPNHQTELLSTVAYLTGFSQLQQGRASAMSVINFVILTGVTLVYLRLQRQGDMK